MSSNLIKVKRALISLSDKNNIEVSRSIGQTDKSKIYSLIKKGI